MTVDQLGHAYTAYRRSAGSRSIVALLAANAIPLVGVLFFGWSLITILTGRHVPADTFGQVVREG